MSEHWHPATDHALLRLRAELLDTIRSFMRERDIMEVETPILSRAGITDVNIHSISFNLPGRESVYLNTSPEFCMKRLLASGSGAIFQVARVFRDDACTRLHQPEFSMLEWYRPGFDHHRLMDELSELLSALGLTPIDRCTYEEAFLQHLEIDPHRASICDLQSQASKLGLYRPEDDRAILLEFLFSHSVAPALGRDKPLLLYDYPACQAALARLSGDKSPTARRFELFVNGIELANGFHELTDCGEQRQRFTGENRIRRQRGLPEVAIDQLFLAALQAGLPDCAGVAIGLDRLLMVIAGKEHINEVMPFPFVDA